MSVAETRQRKLQRLANRIAAGDVVFFIGAGFSLDSEGNDTKVIIARLLARLEALTEYLRDRKSEVPRPMESDFAEVIRRLREGLRKTFWLKPEEDSGSLFDENQIRANLTSLGQNYYLINDWSCSAFESIVAGLTPENFPAGAADEVNRRENQLLGSWRVDIPPMKPMDIQWLCCLRNYCLKHGTGRTDRAVAGKALFLDTVGFDNPDIMGGEPMTLELADLIKNSQQRMRSRHHVLAWLAAEGLCQSLVTTNYDLLIECAYRTAGMLPLNPYTIDETINPAKIQRKAEQLRLPLNRRFRNFTRIADATQFFTHGDGHESALIHKIHGCVERYRIARKKGPAHFRAVLPTIVFTFREIQNWREDSWSRDYLSTLLRTHTVVFAGYSGADPVIHDTFRTVYEEVARQKARMAEAPYGQTTTKPAPEDARAFFFDLDEKREFHGLEMLRAASIAAGVGSPELTSHPNLLTFFRRDQNTFPTVDELFKWLYHLVARELQQQALETELRRVAYQLFGRPAAKDDLKRVTQSFRLLRKCEWRQAGAFDKVSDQTELRRSFARLIGWTSGFHAGLMREYQFAESLLKHPGEVFSLRTMSTLPWYRPISEHPQWAAWGVLIEIAVRRALSVYLKCPREWTCISPVIEPPVDVTPMVRFASYSSGPQATARRCVRIEVPAMPRRNGGPEQRDLAARPSIIWRLRPETVPWWAQADDRRSKTTPAAQQLWTWAALPVEKWPDNCDPARMFGPDAVITA